MKRYKASSADLRQAQERGEFVVYYQPLISLAQRCIVGMEALIRWRHPRHGLLLPHQFIPLAEESGLIVPIGAWVLRSACADAQRMRRQANLDLNVAVNVSPRQLTGDFLRTLHCALEDSDLPPESLTLEITERLEVSDSPKTVELLKAIHSLGVLTAADDFGTGYSNLSFITRFPVAKLKIDRSFVNEIAPDTTETAVTGAIIALGHRLNMKVVAEGVETGLQLWFLDLHHCDEAQGHLFSPALEQVDFLRVAMDPGALFRSAPSAPTARVAH